MAFFKGALAKEGKGVEKNSNEGKSPFWLFIELYARKFWKICQVGSLYLLACIPTIIVVWFCSGLISKEIDNVLRPILENFLVSTGAVAEDPGVVDAYRTIFDILIRIFISLLFMAFWGMGPVTAGYTYILRNYAREEYAWPWSDFWEHTKCNFRQALCVWVIDVIVFVLLIVAFMFYSTEEGPMGLLKYVIAFVFLAYTFMHFYIYQLMVTFRLRIKDIFKNSFLLAIAALPANMLVFILTVIVHGIFPYFGLHFAYLGGSLGFWTIYFIFALFILQGLSGFIINFAANRTIKKYMLDRLESKDIDENSKMKGLV